MIKSLLGFYSLSSIQPNPYVYHKSRFPRRHGAGLALVYCALRYLCLHSHLYNKTSTDLYLTILRWIRLPLSGALDDGAGMLRRDALASTAKVGFSGLPWTALLVRVSLLALTRCFTSKLVYLATITRALSHKYLTRYYWLQNSHKTYSRNSNTFPEHAIKIQTNITH